MKDSFHVVVTYFVFILTVVVLIMLMTMMCKIENIEKYIEFEIVDTKASDNTRESDLELETTEKEDMSPSVMAGIIVGLVVLGFALVAYALNDKFHTKVNKAFNYVGSAIHWSIMWVMSIFFRINHIAAAMVACLFMIVLIEFTIFGCVYVMKKNTTVISSLVGDNPRVMGWALASIVCMMITVMFAIIHILGVFEKRSLGQNVLLAFLIGLSCLTIACLNAALEGKAASNDVVYENFYYNETKDVSFFIQSCVCMFLVMIAFSTVYTVFLHKEMIEVCNTLYDSTYWDWYVNGTLEDVDAIFKDIENYNKKN